LFGRFLFLGSVLVGRLRFGRRRLGRRRRGFFIGRRRRFVIKGLQSVGRTAGSDADRPPPESRPSVRFLALNRGKTKDAERRQQRPGAHETPDLFVPHFRVHFFAPEVIQFFWTTRFRCPGSGRAPVASFLRQILTHHPGPESRRPRR